MRIAYGVMGYGRGHAMRTSAIIPMLESHHEIQVYAGPDAYTAMRDRFDTRLIPCIHYHYNESGTIDTLRTIRENVAPTADLLFDRAQTQAIDAAWDEFDPQVVISDSEAWSHRLARKRGLPRISIDHVGVMAYCKPHFPWSDALVGRRDALGYRFFMGMPDHAIVSSFYPAEPKYRNVQCVGPILRDAVKDAQPTRGDYLVAYFNKGRHQFSAGVAQALRAIGMPVRVYGSGAVGKDGTLSYCAPSQQGFVDDLAGCRAVIATAGNQLAGECVWLGKPMLLLPENAVEQRLNAHMVTRMGIGAQASLLNLTGFDIEQFLLRVDEYAERIPEYRRDGNEETRLALEQFLERVRTRTVVGPRRPPITQRRAATLRT